MPPLYVVGLSAYYHDAACCLLRDGRLIAAAQEERFSRVKGEPRLPVEAFRYCLGEAGIGPRQIDCTAYYELPEARRERQAAMGCPADPDPDPLREIRERLGVEGRLEAYPHHASHAASAFYFSPFASAAVLTADGVGGWTTTAYWAGRGVELERLAAVRFPHSLGLFYSAVTSWLGFAVNRGEGTVMGLAAWGRPKLTGRLRRVLLAGRGPMFRIDESYFDFARAMYSRRLCDLLGEPRRRGVEPTAHHADVAASLQALLEEVLLDKLAWLHRRSGMNRLCMAGGVALNCKSNGRLLADGPFGELFVQPAAGDAGGALGAAALAHVELTGERPEPLASVALGPAFDPGPWLAATPLDPLDFRGRRAELVEHTVERLERGEVVGWFSGRMELGPRALGHRSLLADPRRAESRERLNRTIKRREPFRPFAPALLEAHATSVLESGSPSPYMLRADRVRPPWRERLPAVIHRDGSARAQTVSAERSPRFAALLEAWHRRTGCPALLNTSLNGRGEPIVCSPADALFTMAAAGFDALVLDGFVIDRLPAEWGELLPAWRPPRPSVFRRDLYTF